MRRLKMSASVRRLLAVVALGGVAACGGAGAQVGGDGGAPDAERTPAAPARAAEQTIVIVDFSTSQGPADLARSRRVAAGVIQELTFGDQLVVREIHRAGQDDAQRIVNEIDRPRTAPPGKGDVRRLGEHKQSLEKVLEVFFDTTRAGRIAGTDLFAVLTSVSDHLHEGAGRPARVLILSDMLQSNRELDMEARGWRLDSAWIAARARAGRIPRLESVCIAVVGPDLSTTRGLEVRRFWEEYFRHAGADFRESNYRNDVSSTESLRCG